MKTAFILSTGEKCSILNDYGERARVLCDSGEVQTMDKKELAQEARLITRTPTVSADLIDHDVAEHAAETGKEDEPFVEVDTAIFTKSEQLELFGGEIPCSEIDCGPACQLAPICLDQAPALLEAAKQDKEHFIFCKIG